LSTELAGSVCVGEYDGPPSRNHENDSGKELLPDRLVDQGFDFIRMLFHS
jgi:hypothetical protein